MEDFSFEHLNDDCAACNVVSGDHSDYLTSLDILKYTIEGLNYWRRRYLATKDKDDWWQMIQLLPSSYNQKRTVTMSYENLFAMCSKGQRRFHKLNEWSGLDNSELENFIAFARKLPYAQELIFIDETEPEKVSISKDIYENLLKIKNKLAALEMGGVDNWEGYDSAMRNYF